MKRTLLITCGALACATVCGCHSHSKHHKKKDPPPPVHRVYVKEVNNHKELSRPEPPPPRKKNYRK